jgi:CheY-like chemotaxis protein
MTERGPLVLVVDDYRDAREMYAQYLEASGFRVAEAPTGFEAVRIARELQPDCILMDLALPGIDGWEATRQIKADGTTSRIPIIAITGHTSELASRDARAAGCAAFVIKPALPDAVVSEVRKVMVSSRGFGHEGSAT